jgi:NAD(P)-dependent dehydrogenase (short-subunit alcohol dehydrogenase family)
LRFDGRVALVTGATRGLGLTYAQVLASLGASVVINDIDDDEARAAASKLQGAAAAPADVATAEGAGKAVASALDAFGRLDIVVANAGTSWHRPFEELTVDELTSVLGPSLLGTFTICLAAWPHLASQGYGRLVTTSSGAIYGYAGRAHYAAAKGGVLALTMTMAREGAAVGILANCVLPWGATRLSRSGGGAPEPALAAPAVAWLCHESCRETGAAFSIGGGRIARVALGDGPAAEVPEATPEAYRDALARLGERA